MTDSETPWEPAQAPTEQERLGEPWPTDGDSQDGLDSPAALHGEAGNHVSVRRWCATSSRSTDVTQGHADLLREAVDGLVGEDPAPGWSTAGWTPAPG